MSPSRGIVSCDVARIAICNAMADDDVVETSDLEELEELRTPSNVGRGSSPPPYWRYDQCPPRKRVKVSAFACDCTIP